MLRLILICSSRNLGLNVRIAHASYEDSGVPTQPCSFSETFLFTDIKKGHSQRCITFIYAISSQLNILLGFSLTVKAATLIFISGCGSAISSAKEGTSGFIYNSVKS